MLNIQPQFQAPICKTGLANIQNPKKQYACAKSAVILHCGASKLRLARGIDNQYYRGYGECQREYQTQSLQVTGWSINYHLSWVIR